MYQKLRLNHLTWIIGSFHSSAFTVIYVPIIFYISGLQLWKISKTIMVVAISTFLVQDCCIRYLQDSRSRTCDVSIAWSCDKWKLLNCQQQIPTLGCSVMKSFNWHKCIILEYTLVGNRQDPSNRSIAVEMHILLYYEITLHPT